MKRKKAKRIRIKVPCDCENTAWDEVNKIYYCPHCKDQGYKIRYVTSEEQRVLKYFARRPRKRVNAMAARCKMAVMWSLMDKKLIKGVRTLACMWMREDLHRRFTYFIRTQEGREVCKEF